jgi:hypothetical protein
MRSPSFVVIPRDLLLVVYPPVRLTRDQHALAAIREASHGGGLAAERAELLQPPQAIAFLLSG